METLHRDGPNRDLAVTTVASLAVAGGVIAALIKHDRRPLLLSVAITGAAMFRGWRRKAGRRRAVRTPPRVHVAIAEEVALGRVRAAGGNVAAAASDIALAEHYDRYAG